MASRGVYLHARDLEVLEALADRRVETLNALQRQHWPDGKRKTAYNRLNALAKAGYLQHLRRAEPTPADTHGKPPAEHLYLLGPRAATALRIRGRDTHAQAARRLRAGTPHAIIDHQLATNRIGDWLGTRLLPEHAAAAGLDRRHRPDAAYRARPDGQGRDLVLVETDLGHYSRGRILAKVQGFFDHPDARSILFAAPTHDRANQIARWAREAYGDDAMERLQIFALAELAAGAELDPGTEPAEPLPPLRGPIEDDWYRAIMGPAGNS